MEPSDTPLDEQPVCRDQLLRFVEDEAERAACEQTLPTFQEREVFSKLCADYLNAVRNVAFQNECIRDLIEQLEPPEAPDLRRARASFLGRWIPESVAGSPKALVPSDLAPTAPLDEATVASLRLDISDRLAKRHFARKKRLDVAAELAPTVGKLQMELWVLRQEATPTQAGSPPPGASVELEHAARLRRRQQRPTDREADTQQTIQPKPKPVRVYSDAEVKAVLKRHAKAE
jgi:hypothetical protein